MKLRSTRIKEFHREMNIGNSSYSITSSSLSTSQKLPNKFDLNRAIELMQLSIYTYDQFDYFNRNRNIDNWSPSNASYIIKKTLYTYEKEKGVVRKVPIGFIARKENVSPLLPDIFVAWRGTVTISEWIRDIDITKIKCSFLNGGEMVHEGFHKVYTQNDDQLGESPQKVVIDYLDSISKVTPKYNLWITGHSLGGALAVLNICDIVVNTNHKNAKMYNFACPKVGDKKFVTTFQNYIGKNCCNDNDAENCCSWRIVNKNDLVPKLSLVNFFHVNGCSGTYVCNNANNNANNDVNNNGLFEIEFANKIDVIKAHNPTTYLSTLKNI